MKKIILTLALLMGVFASQAQSLEPNKFFDNIRFTGTVSGAEQVL